MKHFARRTAALCIVVAACTHPAPPTPSRNAAPPPTVPSTAERLRRDLSVFASDSFMGRSAETPYGAKAARFIAARAAELGLEPAGDSGFLQRVPLEREWLGSGTRAVLTTPRGDVELLLGPHMVPLISLGDGVPLPKLSADAPVIFAGHGIDFPGYGRNDLAGLDVTGKVVAFVDEAPPGLDSARRAAFRSPAMLGRRLAHLAERKPAAIVVLATGRLEAEMLSLSVQLSDSSLHLARSLEEPARTLPMVILVPLHGATALLPRRWPRDDRSQPLVGTRLRAAAELHRAMVPAYNVAAIVRGGDSTLAHSYVAFGAHLDHIGVQHGTPGDSVANGADDDGSGSMALLQIARVAMDARPRPRRSFLFVWHTGEELGLFGSEWFTDHPTVPLDSIVAQLNADMIGRNDPDSIYFIGPRQAPNHQSEVLGTIIDSVNASLPRPFLVNRDWDSPTHPEQLYYRSDHYNYARRGIPIVFFTTGLHPDYHQVTDEPDRIDYEKLARVVDLLHRAGVAVANRPTRPLPPSGRAQR